MQRKKLTCVTLSADIIGGNDDLLMEILLLLPAKSLSRFRFVNKHWRSLIDDESFRRRHFENQRRLRLRHQFILRSLASKEFLVCDLTARTVRPLRLRCEFQHVKILQSSHGLLLLECRKSPRGDRRISVYNPTTEKRINLLYERARDSSTRSQFRLVYDPSESNHYTVLHLITYAPFVTSGRTEISVYYSKTQQWEWKGEFKEKLLRFPERMWSNDHLYFITTQSSSLYFSLDSGLMSTGPSHPVCPFPWQRQKQKVYAVESNGHLHRLVLSLNTIQNHVNVCVYEMTDDESRVGWGRLAAFGGQEIEVLGFVREERAEDSILVYHVPEKIMVYRFSDGVSEEIVDFSNRIASRVSCSLDSTTLITILRVLLPSSRGM